jgi:hypothetical protein
MSLQEQIATLRNGLRLDRQSVEYYHGEGPVHRSWRMPNKLETEYQGFKNAQELFVYAFLHFLTFWKFRRVIFFLCSSAVFNAGRL